MAWPTIVLNGPLVNQTLSTIKFDKNGESTNQEIFICENWVDGYNWAKNNNHNMALFVKSGTLIADWIKFCELVNAYPHNGLIAHLIWHPDDRLYLDDQCWFMNIKNFDVEDFLLDMVTHPLPIRSEKNLHDDYTPLWVKSTSEQTIQYKVTNFGQGLIARQLSNNRPIVNWNNSIRDLKYFQYNNTVDLTKFQDYKNIAENQLWIFNNEPIIVVKKQKLVSPGSGLSWIVNIIDSATNEIQLVDISRIQIKFCQELWNNWNGDNYGEFVWNFIKSNDLIHYQFDNPNLTTLDRLKLKSPKKFVEYVNTTFANIVVSDFKKQWQLAKETKIVKFCNDNLINWVLNNKIDLYDDIWCSNILNYKWTLLHTTAEQYTKFQEKLK